MFVSYGKPIQVGVMEVAAYTQWNSDNPAGHPRENPTVVKLLKKIQEGIEAVLLTAPNHETLFKAQLAYGVWSGSYDSNLDKTIPQVDSSALAGYYKSVRHFVALQVVELYLRECLLSQACASRLQLLQLHQTPAN